MAPRSSRSARMSRRSCGDSSTGSSSPKGSSRGSSGYAIISSSFGLYRVVHEAEHLEPLRVRHLLAAHLGHQLRPLAYPWLDLIDVQLGSMASEGLDLRFDGIADVDEDLGLADA